MYAVSSKRNYLGFKFEYLICSYVFNLRFGVKCSMHQSSYFPVALTACVYDVKCTESKERYHTLQFAT
jgi:hypothetical protein